MGKRPESIRGCFNEYGHCPYPPHGAVRDNPGGHGLGSTMKRHFDSLSAHSETRYRDTAANV
jgi:hypothetical protein